MQIIYASSACSKETYEKIFNLRNRKLIDPAQRFFEQLITGTAGCAENLQVVSISARPVSASTTSQRFFSKEEEVVCGARYLYPAFRNGKISRMITTFLSGFFTTCRVLRSAENRKEQVVICDPLCVQISKAARWAAKLAGVPCIAVVTDIPQYATEMKQHKFSRLRHKLQNIYEAMSMREMAQYDAYIILTSAMNPVVNPKGRPSLLVEGSVDANAVLVEKDNKDAATRVVMYAGGVYEKYGLKHLALAFVKAGIENAELHVYGEGSFAEELQQISKENPQIVYKGVVLNADLPKIESQATLLVNPRFSGEDYTKYSFPSKTLEYMSSGTPVLTTRLAGIPDEYAPYLFYFEEENVEAMARVLKDVMAHSDAELYAFGKRAKAFALESKSNVVQGRRIYEFAREVIKNQVY